MTAEPAVATIEGTRVEYLDVTRVFGATRALDGFTLQIEPGELLALLGPSGCGKTTALRLLAGFDQLSSGQLLIDGRDVSRQPVNKRDMGMVFQSYSLFPTMSARDNVGFGLRLRGASTSDRRRRAGELLELVGLSAHTEKYPHQMSGGQQQRVALARALAIQPRVLLLDEPLSALDAKVRTQLRDEIRRIQLELGVTTVFVTHDQEEALSMADRVGVMRAGQLEQCDAPSVLYQRPATPFVAEFVGTMNHLPGVVRDGSTVQVGDQSVPADGQVPLSGTAVSVLARPEAVLVEASVEGDAVVQVATFFGAVTRLRMLRSDGVELLADVSSHRAGELAPGTRVAVSLVDRPVLVRTPSS
ncbi:MAG: putative spermidine/putrescine transport system ATP-binding protein [Pseudonocardiales bacterium]|jgi:putative spermidine/putrescine transport system ATP-binding protein|nr:putative spermidine/putrescine transport system ATP-binding protein [Pseudonocardiales bacterium]